MKFLYVFAILSGFAMALVAFSFLGKTSTVIHQSHTSAVTKTPKPTIPLPTFQVSFDTQLAHSNVYPPTALQIIPDSPTSLAIHWQFPGKKLTVAHGVHWEYALQSGFRIYRDGFWLTDVPKGSTTYIDTELSPNETYGYAVSLLTFDNKIEGQKTASVSAKTVGGTDSKPILFPNKKIITFLAEGDSITEGKQVPEQSRWVSLVGNYLKTKNPNLQIINHGTNASLSVDVIGKLTQDLAQYKPDLVTIAVGVNDLIGASRDIGNVSMIQYRNNLQKIIEIVRQNPQTDVVLLNLYYSPCCIEKSLVWNKLVRDFASAEGVLLVDVNSAMADKGGSELIDSGKIHPNVQGHAVIAKSVIDSLSQYLH